MKEYDRNLRKWVPKEELTKKLKKREKCKGGREHDYVQVLPRFMASALTNYSGNPEAYYQAEKVIEDFAQEQYRKLAVEEGIEVQGSNYKRSFTRKTREYICSVCHKQLYKSLNT